MLKRSTLMQNRPQPLQLQREDTSVAPLVDLHVYVVPPDVWRDRFNNFLNQAVIETVSLGIIRVPPEVRLVDLRQELVQQLEDLVPQEYVFLRSVGRSITRLKSKQEYQYKVKHFVRPQAYADELYLLEASPDLQSFTSRSQSPQSSRHAAGSHGGSPRLHRPHGYRPPETYQGYDDRYTQTRLSPDDNFDELLDRRRYEEERRRRLQEEEDRKRQAEEDDKRNRRADSDDDNDNRGKRGHDNKHRRRSSEEELNRFPSPPPVTRTPPAARDTESARQTRKREKDKLLQELEAAKEERKHAEKEREELVKKAKQLQNKTQNRRNHARDVWKKRYFEEKKKTAPLEDQTSKLRAELDHLHKKLMASLEGPKQQRGLGIHTSRPSQRNNYVIQCTRLQHEIEDLHRRVENAKMKLTAEMKLHDETEAEAKFLRAELTKKKIKLHGHAFTQIY